MSSIATSSSSATGSFFASAADKASTANSYSESSAAQQTDDPQDKDFEKVLDNHVQRRNSDKRSSGRTQGGARKEATEEDSSTTNVQDKADADVALQVAVNAAVLSAPVADTQEMAVPQMSEEGESTSLDKNEKLVNGEEKKAEELIATGEVQMVNSQNEKTSAKTDSTSTSASKFQKTLSKAQDLVGSSEATSTLTNASDLEENTSVSSSTFPSSESTFVWQNFTQQMKGDVTSNLDSQDTADASTPKSINSDGNTTSANTFTVHSGDIRTQTQNALTETLAKEPVQQSTALKLISEAANTQNISLPRRLEVSLLTPEGAVVHVYLQESNGSVRAQLSTNDSDTLKWLHQQIPALKEMQSGDSTVRWLPPQMESQNQYGQQRESFNQQNQQGDEREQKNSQTQTKNEVLDFAKILEKPL